MRNSQICILDCQGFLYMIEVAQSNRLINPCKGSSELQTLHTVTVSWLTFPSSLPMQAVIQALIRVLPCLTMAAAMRAPLQQVCGCGLPTS